MKINLHYMPEKPNKSCEVITFSFSAETGHIYNVMNVEYSSKWEKFNCCDEKYNPNTGYDKVLAWAYMDEVEKEILDEIHG